MVYRSANLQVERLPKAAEELVQLNPDIIVAPATLQAVAAKKATDTIPIVVPVLADPVGLGFVASEARPGGNVTGIAPYVKGLPAKQLELAREVVPGARRIGLVDDVNDPKAHPQRREIEATGKELEIKIVPAEVRTAGDIGSAYDALAAGGVEVVIVEQSNMLVVLRKQIAEAAAAKKLPTVYGYREHVEAGGLISYGVNLNSCFHRAAYYVDRILKGTKPGDLPVEFPERRFASQQNSPRLRAKTGREQMQQHAVRGRQSYSITSSARASSIGGISRPSATAGLRLMISSTFRGRLHVLAAG
jgi:putative ABC transport system substrate-binding protein